MYETVGCRTLTHHHATTDLLVEGDSHEVAEWSAPLSGPVLVPAHRAPTTPIRDGSKVWEWKKQNSVPLPHLTRLGPTRWPKGIVKEELPLPGQQERAGWMLQTGVCPAWARIADGGAG